MTKSEQIRNVILQIIDIEGIVYDMTRGDYDYNTIKQIREALMKIRETNQILKKASYIESDIEEKQEYTAEIEPSVKPKIR